VTILILHQNANDKGEQLESLAASILRREGYEVVSREIGSGGHEIDLVGEWRQSAYGQEHSRKVLVECKAHESRISTGDWLKFLGKITQEHLSHGDRPLGVMIALSGASGNVRGAFRAIKDDNIQLLTGDHVRKLLEEELQLVPIDKMAEQVSRISGVSHRDIHLAYYDHACYWIVTLQKGKHVLIDAQDVYEDIPEDIVGLAGECFSAPVRPLMEGASAYRRQKFLEDLLLGCVLSKNDVPDDQRLVQMLDDLVGHLIHELDYEQTSYIVENLRERGLISRNGDDFLVVDPEITPQKAIEFLRAVLGRPYFAPGIGTAKYDYLIDYAFDEILDLQRGVEPTDAWKSEVKTLLTLSPSALEAFLEPQSIIRRPLQPREILREENEWSDEKIEAMHEVRRVSVLETLKKQLSSDLSVPSLKLYFHHMRGVTGYRKTSTLTLFEEDGEVSGEFNSKEVTTYVPRTAKDGAPEVISLMATPNVDKPLVADTVQIYPDIYDEQ
jgi:Holliday junction resolvase-like predicted endonuclease/uncharacterized protein YeeX (DUF496 family)